MTYIPPGTTVQELVTPSIVGDLATPAVVCVVGFTSGAVRVTELVSFLGGDTQTLVKAPTNASLVSSAIVSVTDANNPLDGAYVVTTDWTFNNTAHTVTRIAVGSGGHIPINGSVYITYDYTPVDYFVAQQFDNLTAIEARYGSAYNTAGSAINSVVSFAAMCAFENGAQDVYVQPLYKLADSTDPTSARSEPSTPQSVAAATWRDTYTGTRDFDDINIIVPAFPLNSTNAQQLGIINESQNFAAYQKGQAQYVVILAGEDGTSTASPPTKTTLLSDVVTCQSAAGGQVNDEVALVYPSKFPRSLPTNASGNLTLTVGGQFMAASIAGMLAARPVSTTLTRSVVAGYTGVGERSTKLERNTAGGLGLLVIEPRGTLAVVRHAITIDTTSTEHRELNVVRAKHRMIESIEITIDTKVIGKLKGANAAAEVAAFVQSTLDVLKAAGDIVDYTNLQYRTLTTDPTTVEVRWAYKPTYAVNYVNLIFSVDLTSGQLRSL